MKKNTKQEIVQNNKWSRKKKRKNQDFTTGNRLRQNKWHIGDYSILIYQHDLIKSRKKTESPAYREKT
jgi:hypothetical protein